jgi:hypothetical protein
MIEMDVAGIVLGSLFRDPETSSGWRYEWSVSFRQIIDPHKINVKKDHQYIQDYRRAQLRQRS